MVKPELVCEIAFAEVTSDGVFRHPSFQGMRIDKKAKEVVHETAIHTTDVVEDAGTGDKHQSAIIPPKEMERKTLLNPKDETQVRKICGHELKFTNLSKIYWPEDKV